MWVGVFTLHLLFISMVRCQKGSEAFSIGFILMLSGTLLSLISNQCSAKGLPSAVLLLHPSAVGQRFPPASTLMFLSCYSHAFEAINPSVVTLKISTSFFPFFPTACFAASCLLEEYIT